MVAPRRRNDGQPWPTSGPAGLQHRPIPTHPYHVYYWRRWCRLPSPGRPPPPGPPLQQEHGAVRHHPPLPPTSLARPPPFPSACSHLRWRWNGRNGGHEGRPLGLQDHHILHYCVTSACLLHVANIMQLVAAHDHKKLP